MSTIFLPGRGAMDLECRRADEIVNEYDERLFAARHPETGIHSVFIRMSPFTDWLQDDFGTEVAGQRCCPILAFPEGFPERDVIVKRLYDIDAARRGTAILDEIRRRNDVLAKEKQYVRSQATGEFAEVAESFAHRQGHTSYHRSLAKRDPKQRGGG